MKSNNTIVQLRGPIIRHFSYDEMIPSYSWPTSDQTLHTSSIYSTTISTSSTSCSTSKENRTPKNEANRLIYNHHSFVADPICSHCNNQRPRTGSHIEFSYEELDEATGGFSQDNFISEGGFGLVFKGRLKDGRKVAVKKLKATSLQGEKEFKSEVHLLSQARHPNVVMLLGSCTQGTHRLLVYEFICNGSLEDNLSGECKPLNWEQRMKIARGAANGLAYLHERSIVHRDMRPGNILITHDYEALVRLTN